MNVRKIRAAELEPGPRFNLVVGKNGSGKTSLLETIHLLGNGRSFRTRRLSELVTEGEGGLLAFCRTMSAGGSAHRIGVEKGPGGTRVRLDGQDVKATSALARVLPTLLIGADCQRLLEEPEQRRRLLDWALFHVEPEYLAIYQRFQRVLRQRNAALRSDSTLGSWDEQLAEAGLGLHWARVRHAGTLSTFATRFLRELLPIEVEIRYYPGWDPARGLGELLREGREVDRRLGHTRRGPQRADLRLSARGSPARSVLSRGESKLLAMGLLLAQAAYFREQRGEPVVVMVDDLGTELDPRNRTLFVRLLATLEAQVFVTSVVADPELVHPLGISEMAPYREFHVEQGTYRQVL